MPDPLTSEGTGQERPDRTGEDTAARLCPNCGALLSSTQASCPSCATAVTGFIIPPPTPERLPDLPGYQVLEKLGQGGMGVVYKARQLHPGRTVAVKMVLGGAYVGPEHLTRFLAEMEAVARLEHPNIVRLYECGQHDGLPFFTLEFVGGGSLADRIRGRPLGAMEAARLVEQLARGLAHVHRQGILHRDLKPANVLLAEDGTPKIADFGLARNVEGGGLTQPGLAMGTPSYVAPEQAEGRTAEIGPAADVYGMGAILYECLTGRPPFQGESAQAILKQVIHSEPLGPGRVVAGLPPDLETICLKCLEKEPGRRYPGALELAEDLARYQRGEPVVARPVGRLGRASRWCKRNPAVAGLLAVAAVLLGGGLAAVGYSVAQAAARSALAASLESEQSARAEAERERERVRRLEYADDVNLAHQAFQDGRRGAALDLLRRHEVDENLHGFEWLYLNQLLWWHNQYSFHGHTGSVNSVCFSPDGRYIASASGDRTVRVWDTLTSEEVHVLRGHGVSVYGLAFSPDGTQLASVAGDYATAQKGEIRLWDLRASREPVVFEGQSAAVYAIAFSPDGTRLATGGADGVVCVWDVATRRQLGSLTGHTSSVFSVALSPDGRRIVSGSWDRTVRVWDAQSFKTIDILRGHTSAVAGVAFGPDSRRVASVGYDRHLRVWDVNSGEEVFARTAGPLALFAVAFSPDGRQIATGGSDRAVQVWDAETGKVLHTLRGHTETIFGVAYSPDGRRIVSGGGDFRANVQGEVKLWDARAGQGPMKLDGHGESVSSVAFSPDGRHVATASGSYYIPNTPGEVKVWDVQTGRQTVSFKGDGQSVFSACFSPDGQRVASAGEGPAIRLWDAATGEPVQSYRQGSSVYSVCFSPDGRQLVSGGKDRSVRLWDAATGRLLRSVVGHTAAVYSVAWSRDGRRIASGSGDRETNRPAEIIVWDADTGEALFTIPTGGVYCVCFSPDGKRLASVVGDFVAGKSTEIKVWDSETGRKLLECSGGSFWSVGWSPDGQRLVSAGDDRAVHIWDAQTGQEVLSLRGHESEVQSASFSPNGRLIVSGGTDGGVHVWDARTSQAVRGLDGHGSRVTGVSFSPDGKRLASRDETGGERLWDVATGSLLEQKPEWEFRHHLRSPDGRLAALMDGARIWLLPRPGAEERIGLRRLAESDPEYHRLEAASAERTGQWFGVAFHLEQLMRLEPPDADLLVRFARAEVELDAPDRAVLHWLQAYTLDPLVSPWPLDPWAVERGESAARAGAWARAVRAFELAVHQPGARLERWRPLLLVRRVAKQDQEFRRDVHNILERFGDTRNADAIRTLLRICQVGPCDPADAERLVSLARHLQSVSPSATTLNLAGTILYRAARYDEAAATLARAAQLSGNGGSVDGWLYLAMTEQKRDQPTEARALLRKAESVMEKWHYSRWTERVAWTILLEEARAEVLRMPGVTD